MKRETFAVEGGEGLPLSDAVRFGDLVFVSGMVAFDEDGLIVEGGIAAESGQVCRNSEGGLLETGCTRADGLKVNIILTTAGDFDEFNAAYRELFPNAPPARISLVAGLTIAARLEVDVIAGISR